jgi:DNA primase
MDTPRLHPDTIEAVRDRADIVDVVSQHVVLKKQGKDFVGCVPSTTTSPPASALAPASSFTTAFPVGRGAMPSSS